MLKKERYKFFIYSFELKYPNPTTELVYNNDYQLLIAVMLSAQCTDKRVNSVTPFLFHNYKNFNQLSKANLDDVFALIKSISYPRNKSKYLIKSSKIIYKHHKGRVPDSFNSLIDLPGVGRKTANIILSVGYNKNEGIAIDTHVKRLTKRLDFTKSDNPDTIELDLMKITKQKDWNRISMLLILHGRAVCHSRSPHCHSCIIKNQCPSAFKFKNYKE